jgi:hypothetical protein
MLVRKNRARASSIDFDDDESEEEHEQTRLQYLADLHRKTLIRRQSSARERLHEQVNDKIEMDGESNGVESIYMTRPPTAPNASLDPEAAVQQGFHELLISVNSDLTTTHIEIASGKQKNGRVMSARSLQGFMPKICTSHGCTCHLEHVDAGPAFDPTQQHGKVIYA